MTEKAKVKAVAVVSKPLSNGHGKIEPLVYGLKRLLELNEAQESAIRQELAMALLTDIGFPVEPGDIVSVSADDYRLRTKLKDAEIKITGICYQGMRSDSYKWSTFPLNVEGPHQIVFYGAQRGKNGEWAKPDKRYFAYMDTDDEPSERPFKVIVRASVIQRAA